MSEQLTAAAEAMGIPELLVERSAAARAAEAGTDTEEILAAWAGGEVVSAPSGEPEEPAEPEAADTEAPEEKVPEEPEPEPATPEIVIEKPTKEPTRAPAPAAAAAPYKPPVLVGARDNPMVIMAAAVGLFVAVLLVGFVGPSFQGRAQGARTSEIAFSAQAMEGRAIYSTLNCDSCHTQMVRPVVADVGLGTVTVHDSNQVLGTRRFGPDLSNVGARVSESQLAATVAGLGDHPPYSLRTEDLEALVSYLAESVTAEGS